jgi:hypothetical protein
MIGRSLPSEITASIQKPLQLCLPERRANRLIPAFLADDPQDIFEGAKLSLHFIFLAHFIDPPLVARVQCALLQGDISNYAVRKKNAKLGCCCCFKCFQLCLMFRSDTRHKLGSWAQQDGQISQIL